MVALRRWFRRLVSRHQKVWGLLDGNRRDACPTRLASRQPVSASTLKGTSAKLRIGQERGRLAREFQTLRHAGEPPALLLRRFLVVVKHAGNQQQFGMRRGKFWQYHPDTGAVSSELLTQRTEVFRLVPVQLVQVQHQPVLAPRE